MEHVLNTLVTQIPAIAIKIAKLLFEKLSQLGGVSPKEQAAIDLLEALEKFLNA